MGPLYPVLLPLDRFTKWVFGGADEYVQSHDMARRFARAFPISGAIMLVALLPGIASYHWYSGVPLVLAGYFYYQALARPGRTRMREVVSVIYWTVGVGLSLAGAALAGPPYAYVWAGIAISLPFIAVIYPLRISLLAAIGVTSATAVVALLVNGEAVRADPPRLIGPLLAMVLTVAIGGAIRSLDRQNRVAVVTDTLTGLGNRVALEQYVHELLRDPEIAGAPVAMVVFDIDHFKALNDRYGHAEGDEALRRVASVLIAGVGDGGGVFRYGGEEFVLLLPSTGREQAVAVAERLRSSVAAIVVGDRALAISGGIAVSRLTEGIDLTALFRRADTALYDAKQQGRDRVCVAPPLTVVSRRRLGTVRAGDRPSPGRDRTPGATRVRRAWRPRIVRTRLERDHLRAMLHVIHGAGAVRVVNLAFLLAAILVSPWLGRGPILAGVGAVVLLDPALRRSRRMVEPGHRGDELAPIWEVFTALALWACAIALVDGEALYLLPMLLVPAFTAMPCYRWPGALIIAGATGTSMVAVAFAVAPQDVLANPLIVTLPLGLLGVVTLVSGAIVSSALEHAEAANVDRLTGALNRSALEARVAEFASSKADHTEPVTLIVADLDHFKAINDEFGHDVGDEVLTAVGQRLQQELRLVDVLYRIGGEEFVVLLPQTPAGEGERIAERLRDAIEREPLAGQDVTISLGLAGSGDGRFDYSTAFDRADAALLAAKQSGRNRVVVAELAA